MSLFMSQRFGRGLYLSGRVSPLVLLWLVPLSVGFWLLRLFVVLLRELMLVIGRAHYEHRRLHPTQAERAAQVMALMRDAVTVNPEVIERDGLVVWAVYGVGDRFFTGRTPIDVSRLARLYPNEVQNISGVSNYPDAASARRAANGLRRAAFTVGELRALFNVKLEPAGREERHRGAPSATLDASARTP